MSPEEAERLRTLRQAASSEAAFLNGNLSLLGKSFNYDADLKLARCELDAIECLIGLIDMRLAVYAGKTVMDVVDRSERRAGAEYLADAPGNHRPVVGSTGAPVRRRDKRSDRPSKPVERQRVEIDVDLAPEPITMEESGPIVPKALPSEPPPVPGAHSRKGKAVLAMELESGVVAEFPSVTKAAEVTGGAKAGHMGGNVRDKAMRMSPRLWHLGPEAILAENKHQRLTLNGWAYIYKSELEAYDPDRDPELQEALARMDAPPEPEPEPFQSNNPTLFKGIPIVGCNLATGDIVNFPSALDAARRLFAVAGDEAATRNRAQMVSAVSRTMTKETWGSGPHGLMKLGPKFQYRGWSFILRSTLHNKGEKKKKDDTERKGFTKEELKEMRAFDNYVEATTDDSHDELIGAVENG